MEAARETEKSWRKMLRLTPLGAEKLALLMAEIDRRLNDLQALHTEDELAVFIKAVENRPITWPMSLTIVGYGS